MHTSDIFGGASGQNASEAGRKNNIPVYEEFNMDGGIMFTSFRL
jgi:hypothetical protein